MSVVIQGTCDHYSFNLSEDFIKAPSKAVCQSRETVVIESPGYFVDCDYTVKNHL